METVIYMRDKKILVTAKDQTRKQCDNSGGNVASRCSSQAKGSLIQLLVELLVYDDNVENSVK